MKNTCAILAAITVVILAGCSTPRTLDARVGPVPFIPATAGPDGNLRVFSATEKEDTVGFQFSYDQRTDYEIYDSTGKRVEHVADNNTGHFDGTPRTIQLAPGTYSIKALAAPGLGQLMVVPVMVEPGRTTDVHLNGHWNPPPGTPESELVRSPAGFAVGWRAASPPNS